MGSTSELPGGGGGGFDASLSTKYINISGNGGEQTILSRSGRGRVLAIMRDITNVDLATLSITSLKITKDGGAEEEKLASAYFISTYQNSEHLTNQPLVISEDYDTSITVKATWPNGREIVLIHQEG